MARSGQVKSAVTSVIGDHAVTLTLAFLVYLAQALLRGREKGEKVEWKSREIWLALAGVGALVVGAFFTVLSTENKKCARGVDRDLWRSGSYSDK